LGLKSRPFSEEITGLAGALERKLLRMAARHRLSRRKFLALMGRAMLGAALTGGGGWAYVSGIEPTWFQLERVELRLPRLALDFDGFRIAQITDIHLSESLTIERLAEVVQTVLAQKPDLIAITGDYADDLHTLRTHTDDLIDVLRPLIYQAPLVTVMGNHDYWVGADAVRWVIRSVGMSELANYVLMLRRGASVLYIAGVDDVWERHARLGRVLNQIPDDGHAAILLAHEPDFADSAALSGRFDLQISGHSHGGQVVIPFFGPPVLPYLAKKYPSGLYQVGGMIQYTSRGVGTIPPRVRFNCRPEITLFTLRSGRED